MNYFLVHIGSSLPKHILHTLRQILFVDSDCKITLCTDSNITFNESRVVVINVQDLGIPETGNYFRNEIDPLWITSLQRIFLVNAFVQKTKQNIIHFDNDVLLLKNITTIYNSFKNDVYITPQTHNTHIFGFSIIKDAEKFNQISNTIYSNVIKGMSYVLSQTGDHGHEMRLLNFYCKHLITDLPIHPSISSIENTVFDPITYGQFLGGTNNGHAPGFIDSEHIVGKIFNPTSLKYDNKKLFIDYNNTHYDIANLHVHGKQLERFTTYDK